MSSVRHVPRFIPTLTEVVDPASVRAVLEHSKPDVAALVQQVQRELQPQLERMIQENWDRLQREIIQEHWEAMQPSLQHEVERMVRQAVVALLGAEEQSSLPKSQS